jgi:hypothetical protein
MTKKLKKDPIPRNASREELAKFWDTHDFTDYLDELKPIKVTFAKNLSKRSKVSQNFGAIAPKQKPEDWRKVRADMEEAMAEEVSKEDRNKKEK